MASCVIAEAGKGAGGEFQHEKGRENQVFVRLLTVLQFFG
jgi:hypothetical protein